jgi:predicted transposase/invertase (TIGR01784 family)
MSNRKNKTQPGGDKFISPLNNDIVRAIFGDQENIRNAEALLIPLAGIPPEDYDGMRIVPPTLVRRWCNDKEGIPDIRYLLKQHSTIHVEVQLRPFKGMRSRILYYQSRMIAGQLDKGKDYSRIRQVISVIILNYNFLSGEDYISTFEFCKKRSEESFTDLQRIVIVELTKLPKEDDGTAAWPHLRFFTCKTEEEMAMLVSRHPEVGGAAAEYHRLTMVERVRMFVDDINDFRRVKRAREAYVREEGEQIGYDKAAAEYQGQLSARDGQLAAMDEQLAEKDEQIRQIQEQIRRLEEEIRRLRGD